MQRYFTGRLDGPQCSGKPLEPIGEVDLGETFIIENTIIPPEREQETLGPLFIKGVKVGDVVSIHIEDVHISEWWDIVREARFLRCGLSPEAHPLVTRRSVHGIA